MLPVTNRRSFAALPGQVGIGVFREHVRHQHESGLVRDRQIRLGDAYGHLRRDPAGPEDGDLILADQRLVAEVGRMDIGDADPGSYQN